MKLFLACASLRLAVSPLPFIPLHAPQRQAHTDTQENNLTEGAMKMTICHKPENTDKSHAARPSLGKLAHYNHRAAVIAAISELTKAIGHAELNNGLYLDRDQRDNTHDAVTAIYDGALMDAERLIWSLGASFCQKEEHEQLGCFAFAVSRMIFDLRTGY